MAAEYKGKGQDKDARDGPAGRGAPPKKKSKSGKKRPAPKAPPGASARPSPMGLPGLGAVSAPAAPVFPQMGPMPGY